MRRTIVALLCVPLALCAACSSSPPAATTQVGALAGKTAAEVISAATTATDAAATAHYVLRATQANESETITGDAGRSSGQQAITDGSLHIQVILVGGVAYVQGNAQSLTTMISLPKASSQKYAGRWIAVHSSDSLYPSISESVILQSAIAQLIPSGTLKFTGLRTVQGRQVIGVRGGLPGGAQSGLSGTATLYVATSRPTVPLAYDEEVSNGKQHGQDTGTFSNWGAPLHLSAPTGAVPFSTVTK
jgi:hypothetical protein